MDLTYKEKLIKYLGHDQYLKPNNTPKHFFHLDCKIKKRKFCTCQFFQPNLQNLEMSNLIDIISTEDFKIDLKENKIIYNPIPKYDEQKMNVLEEVYNNSSLDSIRKIASEFDSYNLSKKDMRDIFQWIQKDKKTCEYCKIALVENNFHKGWKNPETGEYVLLCSICMKKYISGSLEKGIDSLYEGSSVGSNGIPGISGIGGSMNGNFMGGTLGISTFKGNQVQSSGLNYSANLNSFGDPLAHIKSNYHGNYLNKNYNNEKNINKQNINNNNNNINKISGISNSNNINDVRAQNPLLNQNSNNNAVSNSGSGTFFNNSNKNSIVKTNTYISSNQNTNILNNNQVLNNSSNLQVSDYSKDKNIKNMNSNNSEKGQNINNNNIDTSKNNNLTSSSTVDKNNLPIIDTDNLNRSYNNGNSSNLTSIVNHNKTLIGGKSNNYVRPNFQTSKGVTRESSLSKEALMKENRLKNEVKEINDIRDTIGLKQINEEDLNKNKSLNDKDENLNNKNSNEVEKNNEEYNDKNLINNDKKEQPNLIQVNNSTSNNIFSTDFNKHNVERDRALKNIEELREAKSKNFIDKNKKIVFDINKEDDKDNIKFTTNHLSKSNVKNGGEKLFTNNKIFSNGVANHNHTNNTNHKDDFKGQFGNFSNSINNSTSKPNNIQFLSNKRENLNHNGNSISKDDILSNNNHNINTIISNGSYENYYNTKLVNHVDVNLENIKNKGNLSNIVNNDNSEDKNFLKLENLSNNVDNVVLNGNLSDVKSLKNDSNVNSN